MSQPLTTFWRTLTHFDRKQVNLWMGFRNALGIALPLAVGVRLGYPSSGLVAATGALNVAAADGDDSYRKRGARMLTSSVIGAAAVWIGALSARNDLASTCVGVSWAFAAGLMVCLGTAAAYIGMIGSKRKVLRTYQALESEGFRPEEFTNVYAPIGLNIGALSPEEIAVSILAELIAVRRNARGNEPATASCATIISCAGNPGPGGASAPASSQ